MIFALANPGLPGSYDGPLWLLLLIDFIAFGVVLPLTMYLIWKIEGWFNGK